MRVLKFKLHGKTAFFKKPDVNSYYYFTYGNIHKVALLGMFGAIIGYGGYNQASLIKNFNKKKSYDYPEFYEKLKNLKLAIEPINEKGMINKKIQVFNNSIGYCNKDKDEKPCNLIVKEQWLENPIWNIYVIIDNDEALKLEEYIINNKAIYTPYLGKNDHYANISEIEVIENVSELHQVSRIDSLSPKEKVAFNIIDEDDDDDDLEDLFKYSEKLPIGLDKDTNMYVLENFVYSNMTVDSINDMKVYKIKNKNIVFF